MKVVLIVFFTSLLFTQSKLDSVVTNFATYNGQNLSIEGVLLQDFGNLRNDRTSIYIVSSQARTINISSSTKYENLKRAMRVRVTGVVSEYQGVYQIQPSSTPIVLDSNQSIPQAISVSSATVNTNFYHGSAYVEVYGLVISNSLAGSGRNVVLQDGAGTTTIRIWNTTGISTSFENGEYYTIRGSLGTFNNLGQILPSYNDDIIKGKINNNDKKPNDISYLDIASKTFDYYESSQMEFIVKAPKDAQISMTIYNFRGQKIKSFDYVTALGIPQIFTWNFQSDSYQKVNLGTYILYVEILSQFGEKFRHKAPIVIGTRL
jgi:DNA/RNA endonuclease YhcR with UshA esterase domain